jgi:hypothetical protein
MDGLQVLLIAIVGIAAVLLVIDLSVSIPLSRQARRTFRAWKLVAEPLGLVAERGDFYSVAIRGSVASRPFFITHGRDGELVMQLGIEDCAARLVILPRERERKLLEYGSREFEKHGEVQRSTGDAHFDAVFAVRANDEGMAYVERLGPAARRALLEFPMVEVHVGRLSAWLDFGYVELAALPILAARQVLSDLAGTYAEDAAQAR